MTLPFIQIRMLFFLFFSGSLFCNQLTDIAISRMSEFAFLIPAVLIGTGLRGAVMNLKVVALQGKRAGGVSLNPLDYLDPTGSVFVFFFQMGWCQEVELDDRMLSHPKRDQIRILATGTLFNIFCAVLCILLYQLSAPFSEAFEVGSNFLKLLSVNILVHVNIAVYNWLPFYPCQGWHLYKAISRGRIYNFFQQSRTVGFLFLLLSFWILSDLVMVPAYAFFVVGLQLEVFVNSMIFLVLFVMLAVELYLPFYRSK